MMPGSRKDSSSPYDVPAPPFRRLRVYSIDPSLAQSLETSAIRETRLEIPWEDTEQGTQLYGTSDESERRDASLKPGPCGEYLEVIDFDPATNAWYKPVDLGDPYLLAQDGLSPSDGNPQFHQQMVYAVVMRTIRNFEIALGRRALWAPHEGQFVGQLHVYPHALREANAYYSPAKKALLFGYFQSSPVDPTEHLPGGIVFTCLSHDVIAHETAHALLDGMNRNLTEPSNPDVLAFHEAFADIVALFQHFSLPEVLRFEIARTRGDLKTGSLLASLAREFGKAIGRTGALRSAIGKTPAPGEIEQITEPHRRGAILVAAVFDAFLAIYHQRTADLYRLATEGTGELPEGAIHPDLVARLAQEAAKTSQHVLNMCIRTLDYLPPVDITFGDYLRALITADSDLVPDDALGYRVAFMEAFRRRGIFPREARSLSEESLRWKSPDLTLAEFEPQVYLGRDLSNKMRDWNLGGNREVIFNHLQEAIETAKSIIDSSRGYKQRITVGLDLDQFDFEVNSIRPVRRSGPEGQFIMDAVVEITQKRPGFLDQSLADAPKELPDGERPDFWFRGGCTLIIDLETGKLRYCIFKKITSKHRYERCRDYLRGGSAGPSLAATYFDTAGSSEVDEVFSFVHRGLEENS
ncbi:MAG TPA: hypothetical protein ENJ80_15365 [Gammaproteobacteria bacterium]|nr:hypothetical protein [Gammaproteobacteria bacterium]